MRDPSGSANAANSSPSGSAIARAFGARAAKNFSAAWVVLRCTNSTSGKPWLCFWRSNCCSHSRVKIQPR